MVAAKSFYKPYRPVGLFLTKENRIKKELKRISEFFKDIPDNQREIVAPLLQNSAFMKVTMEDMQKIINAEGVEDKYRNGNAQYGTKPSAIVQAYNSMLKNYTTVTTKLLSLIPKTDGPTSLEAFMNE